ncbi:MAG TPA: metalloregulator ArsR/SmtB family transcription factor [Vicinamibacteria bacterium]
MDGLLHAVGVPRRRHILSLLRDGERSAGEIHGALGDLTFGAVSQHLGVLERAGLVSVRREGRSRLYQARPEGLEPLRQWLESMWDDALGRLSRLAEAEAGARREAGEARGRAGAGAGAGAGAAKRRKRSGRRGAR